MKLVLMVVRKLLKSQENYWIQENQKAKNCLSPKNWLSQEKKLSKSGNLSKFDIKIAGLSFLISNARTTFNRLWLAFTKAPIL